jgi:hypothetical protein
MTEQTTPVRDRPRFLVCEDGSEYTERFERFLGAEFQFQKSEDAGSLLSQLQTLRPVAAILLDLDFRRTDGSRLVDGEGRGISAVSREEHVRLVANQGIAILSTLRKRGWQTTVLLFADLEEPRQREYLERTFAPLQLIESHMGLHDLKKRFEQLGKLAEERDGR